MKLRLLPFAVLVVLCFNMVLFAQDDPLGYQKKPKPIYIGPCAGINTVTHSVNKLATFSGDAKCPTFESGKGLGFYAGFTFEYLIGDPKESQSSVIARAVYSTMPASMEVAGDNWPTLVEGANQDDLTPIRSTTQHSLDISYNLFSIEVCYKLNLSKEIPLGITVGPTFDIPVTKNVLQKYKILTPLNVRFKEDPVFAGKYEDNGRTIKLQDGPIQDAASFRLGFKAGIQYEFIPGEGYYIVPAIFYNFGLTKVSTKEDWRVNAIQIGVDVRFAL
jgi:hypothetical protein